MVGDIINETDLFTTFAHLAGATLRRQLADLSRDALKEMDATRWWMWGKLTNRVASARLGKRRELLRRFHFRPFDFRRVQLHDRAINLERTWGRLTVFTMREETAGAD